MSDVKWIKIATDIFDDEKILLIESMPEADSIIVLWFKLLCMAGKQNNCGVLMMNDRIAYTEEMLATIFRRNINTVRLALATFEQFGMIEIVNNAITIPNWEKHQQLNALERSREATRNRVARFRAKQKQLTAGDDVCNVTETVCNADREEKRREEKETRTRAHAHAREETNNNEGKNDGEMTLAFGDGSEDQPVNTLEVFAANNIRDLNGQKMEYLIGYREMMSDDVIKYAIEKAVRHSRGVPTYAYVEKILMNYVQNHISTLEQARAEDCKTKRQREEDLEDEKAAKREKDHRELMKRMNDYNPLDDPDMQDDEVVKNAKALLASGKLKERQEEIRAQIREMNERREAAW